MTMMNLTMDYFDTVFWLLVILFPAMFTLFIRRKTSPQGPQIGETGTTLAAKQGRLWFWTAVAVLVFLALGFSGATLPAYLSLLVFFPFWFLLALPVIRDKDPGWRGVPRSEVRMATLTRRDAIPAGLQRAWLVLTLIWIAALVVAVAGIVVGAPGAELWWLLCFPLLAGAELALFYWVGKRSMMEPEPTVENETAEIQSARNSLRNVKQYGWLGAAAVCVLVFTAPALILIWIGESALMAAIIVGAGGGGLAGIGGGVFGTIADLRRAKLNRLCIPQGAQEDSSRVESA